MKLVAMLRIKDAILTIEDCLAKLSQLVDEIVIVDNGSTDGTLETYKRFPKVVCVEHTQGYHEGRDIRLAHDMAKKRKPDWILWIDGDEVFEKGATRAMLERYMNDPDLQLVRFRLFHFWFSKKLFRVDSKWFIYTASPQREMWRNQPNAYFHDYKLHHGSIQGINGKQTVSTLRIKHYGYLDRESLERKYANYNSLKNDERSGKTMSAETKGMIRIPFIESSPGMANFLSILVSHAFWTLSEKCISLSKNLK